MKKFFLDSCGELSMPKISIVAVIGMIVIGVFIGIISEFYQTIQPSYVGIVIKGGELQDHTVKGFKTKMPFWTEIVPVFTGTLSTDSDEKGFFKTEETINPFRGIQPLSKDGQQLDIDTQISYQVVDAVKFREVTGSTDPRAIEQLLFVPTIRRLVYDYASEYGWKGLVQEGERQEFGQRVMESLSTGEVTKRTCKEESKVKDVVSGAEIIVEAGCELNDLESISQPSDYGVLVVAVNFKKIKPNAKIVAAVEEAQAKEQEVKIAQQEAIIEKANADKAFNIQDGISRSEERKSEAAAFQIRVAKEQEAEGIKALAQAKVEMKNALKDSPDLLKFREMDIREINANANLEYARHYAGAVSESVTIIGTDEATDMSLIYGMPGIVANTK